MKYALALIFVGIIVAFVSYGQALESCGDGFCPPFDEPEYDECCKYFKDACCTHDENKKLKTIFIVVVVGSILSFVGLIACIVGIIACCCCAAANATTPSSQRSVVTTTGYAPVPSNVIISNNTTTTTKPI